MVFLKILTPDLISYCGENGKRSVALEFACFLG